MANVVVTFTVMPESLDVNLHDLTSFVLQEIKSYTKNPSVETKQEIVPVAFGLKSLKITFVMNEAQGSPEELEKKISENKDVASVEVTDVRRAIG